MTRFLTSTNSATFCLTALLTFSLGCGSSESTPANGDGDRQEEGEKVSTGSTSGGVSIKGFAVGVTLPTTSST